ncbi:MAG: NAD(P)/FAD-dependent oxidoreductase [Desulfurococcaceae archaeon]
MRVAIIGGGPAGLALAAQLRNHDVEVFEEHPRLGLPRHCTSVVSPGTWEKLRGLAGNVGHRAFRTLVVGGSGRPLEVVFPEPFAYYVERPSLEERLAQRAESLGHTVRLSTRAQIVGERVIKAGETSSRYDYVVVAEGASGSHRELFYGRRAKFVAGIQWIARIGGIEDNTMYISYACRPFCLFGWAFAVDDGLGIAGFIVRRTTGSSRALLRRTVEALGLSIRELLEPFGGPIPVEAPPSSPVPARWVAFIGDALPASKPYTGGGLASVVAMAGCLAKAIDMGNPGLYARAYAALRARLVVEHALVKLLGRGHWIPLKLLGHVARRFPTVVDYDNHLVSGLRSAALLPLAGLDALARLIAGAGP